MEPKNFPGNLDSLSLIREYAKSAGVSAGLNNKAVYNLCLAVDEIATNIIMHGLDEKGRSGGIEINADMDDHKLTVILEDDSEPFDPRQIDLPDSEALNMALEERPIGGLGVLLAFKGVDEFKYERTGGRNRNIFIVYRPPANPTE
jgi:serine/threonine-protein kinase RsbW